MSALLRGLSAISPPPPQSPPLEYDGFELRWKMFVFRPAEFKFEGLMLLVLGGYLLLHFVGRAINNARARKAYEPYYALIRSQFSAVRPLLSSSSALHLLYASGRRNALCLHVTLQLQPLHDVLSLIWNFGHHLINPALDSDEKLTFEVTLGRGTEGLQDGVGVWGVVDKGVMGSIREKRFDMTYPRMHESAAMPMTHALFAEHNDVTDLLIKTPNVGIAELLAQPAAASILRYFIVTDQPDVRPSKGPLSATKKARAVVVSLRKPANAEDESAAAAWLQVALNVADLLARPGTIKPEVARKLARTRAEVDASLAKQYKKEQEEDAGETSTSAEDKRADKRAARKRAERANMSEKELKKAEELERKREMRKLQKRGMKQ